MNAAIGLALLLPTLAGLSTVLGSLLNLYLRKRVFHPQMIAQWQRHQIEEVSSLQFFRLAVRSMGTRVLRG